MGRPFGLKIILKIILILWGASLKIFQKSLFKIIQNIFYQIFKIDFV